MSRRSQADDDEPVSKLPKTTPEVPALFVYLGTVIVQFHVKMSEQYVRDIVGWNNKITEEKTLRQAGGSAYSAIKSDICDISDNIGGENKMNTFVRLQYEGDREDIEILFVYKHSKHLTYSSIKTTMMAQLCCIKETSNLLLPCTNCPCHETYFPYCYSNKQCKVFMEDVVKKFPTKLTELLKMDDFCDTMSCGNYTEDKWTERLHKCLLFNGYDSELTAHLRGKHTEDSWKPRIPKGANPKCLLFQGAPDFIIKVKKEGALHMDSQEDGVSAATGCGR